MSKLSNLAGNIAKDIKRLREKDCKPEEEEWSKKLIVRLSGYYIKLQAAREQLSKKERS